MVARARTFLGFFVNIRFCFHLPSARELDVLCWYFNLRSVGGACQWVAIRYRVRSEQTLQRATPFCSIPRVLLPGHSQHGGMVRLTIFLHVLRRIYAGPILQTGDWSGKVPTNLGYWRTIAASTQESFDNATSFANWCSLAGNPAAAATDQLHHPDSSRLVRRPDSSVQAGSPPSCQYDGNDLVTSVALAVATSFRQLPVPGRIAQYDWRHTARVCHPANPAILEATNSKILQKSALPIFPPRCPRGAPCHNTNIHSDVSSPLSLHSLSDPHAQHGGGQRQSNRRMVITCIFTVTVTDMLRNSVQRSRGRVDSLIKRGAEGRKRSASPVDYVA